MGGGSPLPPEVVLMEATVVGDDVAVFEGTNAHDGTPVKLVLLGDVSYFTTGEKFKVTFDPLPKSKSA
jgi:hypothetical protein